MINNETYFDSFLPLYYTVPDEWDDAKGYLSEELKKISNVVNNREIGFFLDEETLAGKQFIPSATELSDGGTSQQFRQIFRKVIVFPGLTSGVNTQPHGLTIDSNFTLIQMYGGATDASAFTGEPLPNGTDTITYDATNIIVTVATNYTRCSVIIEYLEQL